MNANNHKETVQRAVKTAFRGKDYVVAKAIPRYPMASEREYRRITRAYVKIINNSLKQVMPEIMGVYTEARNDSRFDAANDFEGRVYKVFIKVFSEIEEALEDFGLEERIAGIAGMTQKRTVAEWKRVVKKTFGLDILEDYYNGDIYSDAVNRWVSDNVLKIKTIPMEMLGDMQEIILNGYKNGLSIHDIEQQIQNAYDVSKSRADFIARDQIGTLTGELAELQQTDAGVKRYMWSTVKDERVRPCHAELEGQVIEWDKPPEMWYDTKSRGRVYTGRYCHPGEDYQCRCVAYPIFDWETIDLPIGGEKNEYVYNQ